MGLAYTSSLLANKEIRDCIEVGLKKSLALKVPGLLERYTLSSLQALS